jgi:hypothetical protein
MTKVLALLTLAVLAFSAMTGSDVRTYLHDPRGFEQYLGPQRPERGNDLPGFFGPRLARDGSLVQ